MQTRCEPCHWSAATGIMHRAPLSLVLGPRHTRQARARPAHFLHGETDLSALLLPHVHAFLGFEGISIFSAISEKMLIMKLKM